MTCREIINAVNEFAPLSLQESWDNSGVQLGCIDDECSGALLCVDVSPAVVDEAITRGCNLIVSHHPLIFKGLRNITGATPVEHAVMQALRHGIKVYSAHTSLDSTRGGVSHAMASRLGAEVTSVLSKSVADPETGLGVVARFDRALSADELVARVHSAFGSPVARCSVRPDGPVTQVAMCGGAGGEFIAAAKAAGAQAYITSDVRYHDFVDHGRDIFIIDIGHYESESCAKDIFYRVISEKFPNFAVYYSEIEKNPINYL
ncbi:MAG: Nif3-like dinuclear metal center hexameric protein [Bacteroidales bacterium]|nr:Nif3-like dinuclear metal center hexameric protein [Bacteroidales bacterium]